MKSRPHRNPRILAALLLAGLLVPVVAQAQPDPNGRLSFAAPLFSINEASGSATITVLRSNGDDDGNITVQASASSGSATAGVDFIAVNVTLSWPDGDDNPRTFEVPILNDTLAEPMEFVNLTLSNPTGGASLGTPNTAFLDIVDNDSGGGPGTCAASPTALCLKNGRFRVSATFATPAGASGTAQAVPLTGDTGYFWFFNSANVEMVVKVLDGCPVNNRFWVFAGGLTNVEVRMTVVDTLAGTSPKVYTNPLRTPFQPIQDTEAFATCP